MQIILFQFLFPILTYFIMFRAYSKFIKASFWEKFHGFK